MQQEVRSSENSISFGLRRSKRLHKEDSLDSIKRDKCPLEGSAKKYRSKESRLDISVGVVDKENFHRSSNLAPRARVARVFAELIVDAPTDASDFEISDCEDSSLLKMGTLFTSQISRIEDPTNERYNFKVFEDPHL